MKDKIIFSGQSFQSPQQPAPRPFSIFVRDQRYSGGHSTAPPQQPRPRHFSSFGWDQRYACHSRPPVNAGLANNIAQGQAQRDVGVDDRAEQQRPTTEIDCHGGPVPELSGPPEATAPLARGGLPLQARRQRRLHHLAGHSHRQPSLSRTRPFRSGFSRTIWRCQCSPSRRDRSSRRRRQ